MDGLADDGFDISLGDSFLRNVYSVYVGFDLCSLTGRTSFIFRFAFGNSTSTGKPYLQLLSRTNSTGAVSQVSTIRGKKLATLPQELPPASLVRLFNSSSLTEPSGDPVGPTNTASSAMLAKVNGLNVSIKEQTVRTYGLLIFCLLVTNVIFSLALLTFAVLGYMRKGASRIRPSSITHYDPVESSQDDNYYSAPYQKPEH